MPPDARRWHHAILSTYGAWVPGDERGYRTRQHRSHVEGDYRSQPRPEQFRGLREHTRASLSQSPVILPVDIRSVVGTELRTRLVMLGTWVLALAVSAQHVHLLVKLPPTEARRWLGLAKKHVTFQLHARGWSGKVWGAGSKVIRVRDRSHQVNTYRYVLKHADQGAWVGVWKEDWLWNGAPGDAPGDGES